MFQVKDTKGLNNGEIPHESSLLVEAPGSSDYNAMDPLENLDRVADYVAWPLRRTTTSLSYGLILKWGFPKIAVPQIIQT